MPPGPDTPSAVEFIATEPAVHRTELVALNVEYMQWVLGGIEQAFGTPPQEVLGQPIADYVAGKIESVCGAPPPLGGARRLRRPLPLLPRRLHRRVTRAHQRDRARGEEVSRASARG